MARGSHGRGVESESTVQEGDITLDRGVETDSCRQIIQMSQSPIVPAGIEQYNGRVEEECRPGVAGSSIGLTDLGSDVFPSLKHRPAGSAFTALLLVMAVAQYGRARLCSVVLTKPSHLFCS